MRELELRLALVCYGGASLAVYMNGITAEILNLVRGSRNFHQPDFDQPTQSATVDVYAEILEALSPNIRIRVIVDVISGASAGGINGIMLARALAHDLDFSPLKKMWLELGDVEELMDQETIADKWSKLYMVPFMHMFGRRLTGPAFNDPEIKRKMMRFVRSRWFEAPFSGDIMLTWMLEAARDLGNSEQSKGSLLPRGHRLDLFVPVTNFYGQKKVMPLHDPAYISEPRHQTTLQFSHQRGYGDDKGQHALCDENIPALGFAARATSSFPGAFPSVSFADLDAKVQQMDLKWGFKEKFLRKNFPDLMNDEDVLSKMSFIDGGVTNNKPFDAAIAAIAERPAHRQVDRRIIFVDPVPEAEVSQRNLQQQAPSFFKTILSSLATIPRAEPIYNDLQDIEAHNEKVREKRELLKVVSIDSAAYTDEFVTKDKVNTIDLAMLASWREQSHESAHKMSGMGYVPYVEMKTQHILKLLAMLVGQSCGISLPLAKARVDEWAVYNHLTHKRVNAETTRNKQEFGYKQSVQAHIQLFRAMDLTYRIRRLGYVIKHINELLLDQCMDSDRKALQDFKRICYDKMEEFSHLKTYRAYDDLHVSKNQDIDIFVKKIQDKISLEEKDLSLDEAIVEQISNIISEDIKLSLIRAYIGFTFYDVLSLPFQNNFDHFDQAEIKVNRISPQDCKSILGHNFPSPLMGTELYNFGAFFSKKARENDYLWGRIHSANRLLDFLISAARPFGMPAQFDKDKYRRKLMLAIIQEEEGLLKQSDMLLNDLKAKWQ